MTAMIAAKFTAKAQRAPDVDAVVRQWPLDSETGDPLVRVERLPSATPQDRERGYWEAEREVTDGKGKAKTEKVKGLLVTCYTYSGSKRCHEVGRPVMLSMGEYNHVRRRYGNAFLAETSELAGNSHEAIEQASARIDELGAENDRLQREVDGAADQISALRADNDRLAVDLKETKVTLEAAQLENERLRVELAAALPDPEPAAE